MLWKSLCTAVFLAVFVTQSNATAREIGWADLVDRSAQVYEDPYRDLILKQIRALRDVVSSRDRLAAANVSSDDRLAAEEKLATALKTLDAQDINADWVISQRWLVAERRERAVRAGNSDVDGQIITLSGFALAAPPADDGTPVAYLVPQRGLCSHLPPPNPNQMIRVRLSGNWRPAFAHEPVRLTGRVTIDPTAEVFRIVDGPVQMHATFLMEAEKIETMADMRANADPDARREWAQQLNERLRSSRVPHSFPRAETE